MRMGDPNGKNAATGVADDSYGDPCISFQTAPVWCQNRYSARLEGLRWASQCVLVLRCVVTVSAEFWLHLVLERDAMLTKLVHFMRHHVSSVEGGNVLVFFGGCGDICHRTAPIALLLTLTTVTHQP
jgi:hypothetical protein